MTSTELFLNPDYYGKHYCFDLDFNSQKDKIRSLNYFFVSDNIGYVKNKAILNCKDFEWSYFMCFLGLLICSLIRVWHWINFRLLETCVDIFFFQLQFWKLLSMRNVNGMWSFVIFLAKGSSPLDAALFSKSISFWPASLAEGSSSSLDSMMLSMSSELIWFSGLAYKSLSVSSSNSSKSPSQF